LNYDAPNRELKIEMTCHWIRLHEKIGIQRTVFFLSLYHVPDNVNTFTRQMCGSAE